MSEKPRLLLVEDNVVIQRFTSYLLRAEGFDVQQAANGWEALKCIEVQQPDLIICDLVMPVMGGEELFLQLRQKPETAHIPFIIVSANYLEDVVNRLIALGITAYLTKPYESEKLLKLIRRNLPAT